MFDHFPLFDETLQDSSVMSQAPQKFRQNFSNSVVAGGWRIRASGTAMNQPISGALGSMDICGPSYCNSRSIAVRFAA